MPVFLLIAETAGPVGGVIDLVAIVLVAFSAVRGAMRGLTGELARLAGLVSAIFFGYALYAPLASLALRLAPSGNEFASGALVILELVAVVTVVSYAVRWMVDRFLRIFLGQPLNSILGVAGGGLKAVLILVVFFFLANLVAFGRFEKALFESSRSGALLRPAVEMLQARVPGKAGGRG